MGPEDEKDGNHNQEGEGDTQATENDETMTENK
jgi:hypothetical protein